MPPSPAPGPPRATPPAPQVFGYAGDAMASSRSRREPAAAGLAAEDVERELRRRVYRFFLQVRFAVAPLPLLLGCIVVVFDPTLWRRIAIVCALGTAAVLSTLEDRAVRRGRAVRLPPRLAVIAVIQGVVVLATGGVMSPVVMALLVVCFVASTMPERRAIRLQIAAVIAWLWVVAGLELSGVLGPLLPLPFRNGVDATPAPLFVIALLLVETMLLLVTLGLGAHIRMAFSDLLTRETSARDESLRTHAERIDELTRLAGEIAHELKNPLASVKGLAALLARRCRDDQQEHLAVLRGEVDRMQATLEGFLNLSRPLVPLTTRATDLDALLAEVAALHEGQLAQKRLRLEVVTEPGTDPTVQADPRKIHQVLVNLLQNAIEACPEQGAIRARLSASPSEAQIALEDAGPGVAPGLLTRAFDAGVTTKPKGSGFGLTVARGLARQHGGEVTLESPPGRGCVATLRLPRLPPVVTPSPIDPTPGEPPARTGAAHPSLATSPEGGP